MNVNISSLPRLPISERKKLPNSRGLYFVLSEDEIVYIGQTINFKQRWIAHHISSYINSFQNVDIAWWQTQESADLSELENKAISFFQPKLNGIKEKTRTMSPKQFRIRRAVMDLTQVQLAELLGVQANTVSRYETEDLKIPKAVELALDTIERKINADDEQAQVSKK
jgi:DNA-binding transcriptional regulator YiaG